MASQSQVSNNYSKIQNTLVCFFAVNHGVRENNEDTSCLLTTYRWLAWVVFSFASVVNKVKTCHTGIEHRIQMIWYAEKTWNLLSSSFMAKSTAINHLLSAISIWIIFLHLHIGWHASSWTIFNTKINAFLSSQNYKFAIAIKGFYWNSVH